jgi:hypothetical protein
VDFGTHAGIQVLVGDFCSILTSVSRCRREVKKRTSTLRAWKDEMKRDQDHLNPAILALLPLLADSLIS